MIKYNSKFTGQQVDGAVEKIINLNLSEAAFIVLESSEIDPVDLNNLITPKKYLIYYYINGVPGIDNPERPIKFHVDLIADDVVNQTYMINGKVYTRNRILSSDEWSDWGIDIDYYAQLRNNISEYGEIGLKNVFIATDDSDVEFETPDAIATASPILPGYLHLHENKEMIDTLTPEKFAQWDEGGSGEIEIETCTDEEILNIVNSAFGG